MRADWLMIYLFVELKCVLIITVELTMTKGRFLLDNKMDGVQMKGVIARH